MNAMTAWWTRTKPKWPYMNHILVFCQVWVQIRSWWTSEWEDPLWLGVGPYWINGGIYPDCVILREVFGLCWEVSWMWMWESKSVGQVRVCLFAERFRAPPSGTCVQDWHTSQALWFLLPSSWRILRLLPTFTMPLWKTVRILRNRGINGWTTIAIAIDPSRRRRDEWMNDAVEATTGSLPGTQLPWTVTCTVRGAWLCRTRASW